GAAIYLTCYHVLQKANDQRAGDILAAGYAFVQDRATRISDPVLRQSFLENLIEVNALVNEFERNHVGTFRQTSTEPWGGHPVTV
ncbi:MAG: hypothetical protein KDH90_15965, partial [Anaerolineae bacterium]|nr:hypothetical protein [Anaerolineae bacterium]